MRVTAVRLLGLCVWLTLGWNAAAEAHWVRPEQVLAQLRAPELAESYGIVSVEIDVHLERLLVIRVDDRWRRQEPFVRRSSAEAWRELWRRAVPQGVLAIIDAESSTSLVGFDGRGRAVLRGPSHGSSVRNGEAERSAETMQPGQGQTKLNVD
ncbi:MAG: hypothetical protein ACE5FG_03515 [Myxococcota bacterium]